MSGTVVVLVNQLNALAQGGRFQAQLRCESSNLTHFKVEKTCKQDGHRRHCHKGHKGVPGCQHDLRGQLDVQDVL